MTDNQKPLQDVISPSFPDYQAIFLALTDSQFVPFFQPLVTLRTGQLAGFEVLARWRHPTKGLIPPDTFIPLAERDGWIGALTHQILRKALAEAAALPGTFTIAFNVSPLQLRDLSLPEQIRKISIETGFPLSRLIVEVTESALIADLELAVMVVAELKAMGCRLALDDFGTGYSSLHYLQCLPFDELKVDRSFVSSMVEKRDSRKIVSGVVGLGQSLGMITVAEGIETQEQAEMVLWLGCELGQGYFYGRPMPPIELAASVSAHREKIVTKDLSPWKRISASNLDATPSQRLAQLQAVYDGAPVGLAFIDQNLHYLNLNKKFADMNGAPVETHLGSHVSEIIPDYFPQVEPYIKRALAGEPISDIEVTHPGDGKTRLSSYQPARDEAGEVVGVAIAVTDISQRKRTEDALKQSEAHYRSMVELNPQVLWIMDPHGRNLDVSPRWDKVTGLMKSQSTDQEWLRFVHPEDLQSTVQAIAESRRSGSPIDVEYRVADDSEHWTWKRSMGSPRFDLSGNIVCWCGSVQDIPGPSSLTEAIATQTEHSVQVATTTGVITPYPGPSDPGPSEEELRLQAILELDILDTPPEAEFDDLVALASQLCNTPISLISLLDMERQWFKASMGLDASETPISSSFCMYAIRQQGLFQVEDTARDERFKQNPLVLGDPKIRFYAGMPLYASGGIAIGTLCVIDIAPRSLSPNQCKALAILSYQVQARMELRSERRKLLRMVTEHDEITTELKRDNQALTLANAQLESLATTDFLTGLLNRRALEDRMNAAFATASRKYRQLSVLVMDIDYFKKRNDQFGHAAGDDALRQLGVILRTVLRAGDTAARIGGEEFAIVLPETSIVQAVLVAKRIQQLLRLVGDADSPPITLSIGIACMEATTPDWESLFSNADLAMYTAKRTGRNKFCLHQTQNLARPGVPYLAPSSPEVGRIIATPHMATSRSRSQTTQKLLAPPRPPASPKAPHTPG